MTRARHARPRSALQVGLLLAACVLALVGVVQAPAPSPAAAAGEPLVTTESTQTVAWTAQERHPDDLADPRVGEALRDWQLRVSQTRDLLNQTVEVSWTSSARSGFVQLMQCWSDGPDVPPTREQCAYGGTDLEAAATTGAGRTRQLGADPRERTYRNDGALTLLTVNGQRPGPTWGGAAEIVLGTSGQTCPSTTVDHVVTLVAPRDAVTSGATKESAVVAGPLPGLPASLTRTEGLFTRTYPVVTPGFRLAEVPLATGTRALPSGQYRVQLGCRAADGGEVARFVGYVELAEVDGVRRWRQPFREGGVSVPFDPLGSTPQLAPTDPYVREEVLEYLKPRSTNEVVAARVRPDGGGAVFMEVQTDLEAQHLGCGRVEAAGPRTCWLVAVPRWTPEPDGENLVPSAQYSPLSQTLWDRRIAVPLRFAPVATGCRIGSGLKQLLSNDSALAALRSWQPTFCDDAATASSVLGPLQDFTVRAGIAQPNRLGVVTVPPAGVRTVVSAPLLTSGVVVGFVADRQIPFTDDAEAYAQNETRNTVMNLNARLVAKLLTQSYDSGAAPNGARTSGYNGSEFSGGFRPTFVPARSFPAGNPRTMYDDPEFLSLNPQFASWLAAGSGLVPPTHMADVLVTANETDAYQVLWRWVLADADARAFLDGRPDPSGMLVNPYYKGAITADTASFPVLDPTCVDNIEAPEADGFPLLCQLNLHPRVDDDAKAAQAAIRGDTKRVNVAPTVFTGAVGEGSYRPEPRQEPGRFGMLVITTSPLARRFGLPTAALQNSSGEFVAPTEDALAEAREQMAVRADGVLIADPARARDGAYPLTTTSYAVVDVSRTTAAQNTAFAEILEYGAGPGQRVGNAVGMLPPGYAPLTPALAARTLAAAALLRDPSSLLAAPAPAVPPAPPVPGPATADPDPAPLPVAGGGLPAAPVGGVAALPLPAAPAPGGAAPAAVPGPQVAPDQTPVAVRAVGVTTSPEPALPLALPALALLALLAAIGSRLLPLLGRTAS